MPSEYHLFIIWENARNISEKILEDIKQKFNIIKVYDINWSKECFNSNLTRFYNENLPPNCDKETHCGNGPFLLIIIEDKNPSYGFRKTSKGIKYINTNMFDAKDLYRDWSGGGHKIHCTNNETETASDLTLLLGKNPADFIKENSESWNGQITNIKTDLVGTKEWTNIQELFYVLNQTSKYVVLRNYECLPDNYNMEGHGDIDLLTDNINHLVYITNAQKVFDEKYRVHYKVKINGEYVLFDFRYAGDNYYCKKWEKNILNKRIYSPKGIYIPDTENYFYTLLYHGLIHKKTISNDYLQKLSELSNSLNFFEFNKNYKDNNEYLKFILSGYLSVNNYQFTRPVDKSVYFNIRNISGYKKSFYDKYIKIFFWPINKIYAELRRFYKKLKK